MPVPPARPVVSVSRKSHFVGSASAVMRAFGQRGIAVAREQFQRDAGGFGKFRRGKPVADTEMFAVAVAGDAGAEQRATACLRLRGARASRGDELRRGAGRSAARRLNLSAAVAIRHTACRGWRGRLLLREARDRLRGRRRKGSLLRRRRRRSVRAFFAPGVRGRERAVRKSRCRRDRRRKR